MSGSQMSPAPSLSMSAWSWFGLSGQLSKPDDAASGLAAQIFVWVLPYPMSAYVPPANGALQIPSPSRSGSQASPMPSASASDWFGLYTFGQLSATSSEPSPSVSRQTSPGWPAPPFGPVLSWPGLEMNGQLSVAFGTPSPSTSSSHASGVPSRSMS